MKISQRSRAGSGRTDELTTILVVNAGSSSLKVSAVCAGTREPLASTNADWSTDAQGAADRQRTLSQALDGLPGLPFDAAAHRVVHGGTRFRKPTLITDSVLDALDELSPLAPLHNPVAVETIRAQRALLRGLPAVAVFDTAFHATLEEDAYVYPLPWQWYDEWHIRRFGFHGLSVQWSVQRAAELLCAPADSLALVVAHLGSGSSVTAVLGGRSVSTSMGFTPLEGVMMGTRPGSVDAGVLFYAMRRHGLTEERLEDVLEHESGLLGVSGISADMRTLLEAAGAGNERAKLAIDIFVRRAAEGIAAAASSLPRLDGLVFTGGIGENAAPIRAAICARLAVLGVPAVPAEHVTDDALLGGGGATAVLRIAAREDLVMADAAAALIGT